MILPEENNTDLEQLANKINEHKISHLICTPTIYKQLLINDASQTEHKFASLHSIILGGETFCDELITKHKKMLPNAFLFNEYGLTETTVWTTVQTIYNPKQPEKTILKTNMGKPISNSQIYILDFFQNLIRYIKMSSY